MIVIVNIMTLCYKVIKEAVFQSQHLAYMIMKSLVRRLACPPRAGGRTISWNFVGLSNAI